MAKISNDRIADNIQYMLKARGEKNSDLENAINVCNGYIAGVRGRGAFKTLPLDKLVAIADYFAISLDKLVFTDRREEALTEQINKLYTQFNEKIGELEKELESLRAERNEENDD